MLSFIDFFKSVRNSLEYNQSDRVFVCILVWSCLSNEFVSNVCGPTSYNECVEADDNDKQEGKAANRERGHQGKERNWVDSKDLVRWFNRLRERAIFRIVFAWQRFDGNMFLGDWLFGFVDSMEAHLHVFQVVHGVIPAKENVS